jgi:hypothetical protein
VPWIEKNLHIDKRNAQIRMQIGSLPQLPKSDGSIVSQRNDSVVIADIAKKRSISPNEAAKRWVEATVRRAALLSRRRSPEALRLGRSAGRRGATDALFNLREQVKKYTVRARLRLR